MSTIHFHETTTSTPEQFVAGLTDFGPGSDVDAVVVRDGKNFKGRVLGLVLGIIGKSRLESAFSKSIEAIEARNNGHAR